MGLRTGAGWCLHILLSRSANILGFAGHQSLPFDRRLAPDQLRRLCRAYPLPAASSTAGVAGAARYGLGCFQAALRCWWHSVLHSLRIDRKSTRLNSSHANISYAVFCLKKKKKSVSDL